MSASSSSEDQKSPQCSLTTVQQPRTHRREEESLLLHAEPPAQRDTEVDRNAYLWWRRIGRAASRRRRKLHRIRRPLGMAASHCCFCCSILRARSSIFDRGFHCYIIPNGRVRKVCALSFVGVGFGRWHGLVVIVVALLWWRKKVPEVRSENAPFWRHESWG